MKNANHHISEKIGPSLCVSSFKWLDRRLFNRVRAIEQPFLTYILTSDFLIFRMPIAQTTQCNNLLPPILGSFLNLTTILGVQYWPHSAINSDVRKQFKFVNWHTTIAKIYFPDNYVGTALRLGAFLTGQYVDSLRKWFWCQILINCDL